MGGAMDHWSSLDRPAHRATRATVIGIATFALLAVTLFTPVMATNGDGDLESVRATVTETYNYKINLLSGLKGETDNGDRKAVYQDGINQLTQLRDTNVATETSVDGLWSLKEQAHAIYHETVNRAEKVGQNPAEKLEKAKRSAYETIEYKISLLKKWIEGCDNPAAQSIVADGVAQLKALFDALGAATTPDEANAIKDRAHTIYHTTIDAAERAKDGKEKEEAEPSAAEKAAEALEAARRDTLAVISRKAAILRTAAAAASIPAVVAIYDAAASTVDALTADARSAKTKGALTDIKEKANEIYETAKGAALEVRDDETSDPVTTVSAYLDSIANYVTSTTEAAGQTADDSPDTFADLVGARDDVLGAVEAVREVAESGNRLGQRWEDLNAALSTFRLALIRHYVALGQPLTIAGVHIPG